MILNFEEMLEMNDVYQPPSKKAKIEFSKFECVARRHLDMKSEKISEPREYEEITEPYEKGNTREQNVELFKFALNKTPRAVQENLLEFVHKQVEDKKLFVIDLPTGGGKSALAGFAGAVAIKHYGKKRFVYVTSSKSLQKQVVNDAKSWNLFETRKRVVCQMGKGNYFCPKRLKVLLDRSMKDSKNIVNICNGSQKLGTTVFSMLKEMQKIDISLLDINDDFYTTSYREKFFDKLKSKQIPEPIASEIWNEISVSGGSVSDDTKCSCRKEISRLYKESIHGDPNLFLAKNLKCAYCKVRALSKSCGVLVTNMDAIFSYAGHAGLQHIINDDDFIVFDEAHNLCKRAQDLFDQETQRPFNAKKVEEALLKWSGAKSKLCVGNLDHKMFYDFPDKDRSVLTFGNRNFGAFYGKVYESLLDIVPNSSFTFEKRSITVDNIKKILEVFENEKKEFDVIHTMEDLRAKVGHICNVMGIPYETGEHIRKEACTKAQLVLGEPEERDFTDNTNKALFMFQEEFVIYQNEKMDDEFLKECYKIFEKGDKTIEHLYNVVNEVHKTITDIEVAKLAFSKLDWLNKKVYEENVPKVSKDGISYDLTFMKKASILKETVWDKLTSGAMFMSATVSHPEKDSEYAFEDFFTETGIPESTICKSCEEVFDSSRITIYTPPMTKYSFNSSFEVKKKYNNERIHYLTNTIKMNPRATLVLSNNVEDYKSVIYAMKKNCKTHKHIDYNRDHDLFDEFEKGDNNNYVIYGAEKLWTGLNLPGRIGLVVILKPFNKFRMLEDGYYSSIFQKYIKETGKNCIEEFNSLYRYNTCRDTIQAAGRVMRKEDDYGVVMFLSDNRKDAEMLKNKYKKATMILGKIISQWPRNTGV